MADNPPKDIATRDPKAVQPQPKSRVVGIAQRTRETTEFSGPLPPPEMLANYDRIYQGCAKEIVTMAVNQAAHRQRLEAAVVTGNVQAEKRGQYFAFILGSLAIVGGCVLIGMGKDAQGLTSILGSLATLAGVFIYGRWQQQRERERKARENPA